MIINSGHVFFTKPAVQEVIQKPVIQQNQAVKKPYIEKLIKKANDHFASIASKSLSFTKPATKPLAEKKLEPIAQPIQHKTFRGIRVWISSMVSNKHAHSIKERSSSKIQKNESTKVDLGKHARDLLANQCNKKGDALLMSFGKGRHSALAVYDHKTCSTLYFSFGSPNGYSENGRGSEFFLQNDMSSYGDSLAPIGEYQSQNIVKLSNIDVAKVVKAWSKMDAAKFNPLWNNCSAATRNLLKAGYENHPRINIDNLSHNRPWQMPANTHAMALEINQQLAPVATHTQG